MSVAGSPRTSITSLAVTLTASVLLVACSDDAGGQRVEPSDVAAQYDQPDDSSADSDGTDDALPDEQTEPDANERGPLRVEIDLSAYASESGSGARVFQAQSDDDLLGGEAAEGRTGDYVLENGLARFIIEGDDRVISPCPYGGNPIDLSLKQADGQWSEDVMGELCLLLQLGQTVDPDRFEVLDDGESGGTAILAVTGHLELLDFFNLFGMIDNLAPGLVRQLSVDAEVIAPLTVTTYYLLAPDSRSLHVVTAIRNDGDATVTTPYMHIAEAGGEVEFFNPLSPFGGFGFSDLSADALSGEPMPFLAFGSTETSYAWVPDANPDLGTAIPTAGAYLMIAGIALALLDNDNVLDTLLTSPGSLPRRRGMLALEPGDISVRHSSLVVGDGSISSVVDEAFLLNGTETGAVEGVVRDASGVAVAGAEVSALMDGGASFNRARSGGDGRFLLRLPVGQAQLVAHSADGRPVHRPEIEIVTGESVTADPTVALGGTIAVQITSPEGDPLPARLTVMCAGACPDPLTTADRDVRRDKLPSDMAAVVFSGPDGLAQASVPAGDYRVVVSRGLEYSTWPSDAVVSRGHPVTVTTGAEHSLEAEIARVIDSSNALAAELHVHTLHSMDTAIPVGARVRGLVGEGIEVLVATDHDVITDFAPQLSAHGLDGWAVGVMGEEISTDTYGHFNGFPLARDATHRHGGALDWAGGPGLSLPPSDIFDWIDSHPGEQVVQVNHADNLGMIQGLNANVLRGTTRADPGLLRLPGESSDGDTGLWSDAFTAFEVLNGKSDDGTYSRMRWWLAMIGRGFAPTGTAVTDSHTRFGFLGAAPRSLVFGVDLDTFSPDAFAQAINDGAVIGTTGPFIEVVLENADGEVAGPGETLAALGQPVDVVVHVQTPDWMTVDTVQVFTNIEDVSFEAGRTSNAPVTPSSTHSIEWVEGDLVTVASGEHDHRRWEKVVRVPVDFPEDAYVVVMVVDASGTSRMYPVVRGGDPPMAFANPVFVDADGGGYDHPPYPVE